MAEERLRLATDEKSLARELMERGLLTRWQLRKLRAGKTRGFRLGNYRLLDILGQGGMSRVFLAEHVNLRKRVALKVLPESKATASSHRARFLREARAMARLNHPNVVGVFDFDEHQDTYYMALELVLGSDLKARVRNAGPLQLVMAADYVGQAADGLHHLHQHGLVHRDIKPANLVASNQGTLKILDLGLALADSDGADEESLTKMHSESMMGTADYLAPEQARDSHGVDHRADIYSLGCTFYFLLTGTPPFTGGTLAQRVLRHQTERPQDVRAMRSDCPHALAEVCMRMLAKDPQERFDSAGKVAERLHRWRNARLAEEPFDGIPQPSVRRHIRLRSGGVPVEDGDRVSATFKEPRQEVVRDQPTRRRTAMRKAPLALWLFLGLASALCVALGYVVWQR